MAASGGAWTPPILRGAHEPTGAVDLSLPSRAALASRAVATKPEWPRALGSYAAPHQPLVASAYCLSSLSPAPHGRYYLRQEPDAVVPLVRICGGGREQSRSLLRPFSVSDTQHNGRGMPVRPRPGATFISCDNTSPHRNIPGETPITASCHTASIPGYGTPPRSDGFAPTTPNAAPASPDPVPSKETLLFQGDDRSQIKYRKSAVHRRSSYCDALNRLNGECDGPAVSQERDRATAIGHGWPSGRTLIVRLGRWWNKAQLSRPRLGRD